MKIGKRIVATGSLLVMALFGAAPATTVQAQVNTPPYGAGPGASGVLPATDRQIRPEDGAAAGPVVVTTLPRTGGLETDRLAWPAGTVAGLGLVGLGLLARRLDGRRRRLAPAAERRS